MSVSFRSLDINPEKALLAAGEGAGADIALCITNLWNGLCGCELCPQITGVYSCATSGANAETVPEEYQEHFISFEQNADAPMQTIEAYEVIQSKPALRM